MQITHNKCYPNFIHENLLSSLRADGYKLAVASNAVKNSVETMMRLACLDGYLDFMFSNEDVKAGKPDPEIYNLAIQSLKLSADEVVIVEDNFHGIEAAKKSGAHVLEVDSIEYVNIDNVYNFIQQVSNT